jgi:hypothetical protein
MTLLRREITHCFLRVANLDNALFDRLARYEATLWRQIVQALIALKPLRRQRYRFGLGRSWLRRFIRLAEIVRKNGFVSQTARAKSSFVFNCLLAIHAVG